MQYFLNALKNKYADFNGRARRAEYWQFFLYNILISIAVGVATRMIHLPALSGLYSLAVLIPGIAVAIRRMHDVNKSGWFVLVPIYNLILACTEGTNGPNEYGPDPKNATATATDVFGTPPSTY